MRALVVYESMWGNTRAVAEGVARGLGDDTDLLPIATAPARLPDDVDLLVVGGPTHAFSMSRRSTRHEAALRGAKESQESTGIREWLDSLPSSDGLLVATFDTRVAKVRHLPGSAAKAAGREVRRHHIGRILETRSFYVDGPEGPLLDGELDRAQEWGAQLTGRRAASDSPPAG